MQVSSILVVEDDGDIRELIRYNLQKEGYDVVAVSSGETAIKEVKSRTFDLILLDLMLPGIDGLEICKLLKSNPQSSEIPIIMVTAKGEEADIVVGLELGADDYIVKPFSPKVLAARAKAVMRRKQMTVSEDRQIVNVGDLTIHSGKREVLLGGKQIELTYTEFELLKFLAQRPGWVFTRYQIVDALKGEDYPVTDRSVDVHIVGLRKKLGHYGELIETIRGVGYRFIESGTES